MELRFVPGGAYLMGIQQLRDQARSNAALETVLPVRATHPRAAGAWVNVYVNFAFQSNKSGVRATASLYTVAIGNASNTWHFRNVPTPAHSVPFPGNLGGEYGSLGYGTGTLPTISDGRLAQTITYLSGYTGGPVGHEIMQSLAVLIIAISEATRFGEIAQGIDGVLGKAGSYLPPWATVHAWGGNFLSS